MPTSKQSIPERSRLDPWRSSILHHEIKDDKIARKAQASVSTVERYRRRVAEREVDLIAFGRVPLKVCSCCKEVRAWSWSELEGVFGTRPQQRAGQTVRVSQPWCRVCRRRRGPPGGGKG